MTETQPGGTSAGSCNNRGVGNGHICDSTSPFGKFLLVPNTQAAGTTSDLPAVDLPAVDLPAVDLAAVDRPAFPLGRTSQDFPQPPWALSQQPMVSQRTQQASCCPKKAKQANPADSSMPSPAARSSRPTAARSNRRPKPDWWFETEPSADDGQGWLRMLTNSESAHGCGHGVAVGEVAYGCFARVIFPKVAWSFIASYYD